MLESIVMALVGGTFIGFSASILLITVGRIAGISGILGGLLEHTNNDRDWRMAFLAGLFLGGGALMVIEPSFFVSPDTRSLTSIAIAGLLVGFGVRMGNGCTSGHGVCGLTRFSTRSLVATLCFMGAGIVTATAIQLLQGGVL